MVRQCRVDITLWLDRVEQILHYGYIFIQQKKCEITRNIANKCNNTGKVYNNNSNNNKNNNNNNNNSNNNIDNNTNNNNNNNNNSNDNNNNNKQNINKIK